MIKIRLSRINKTYSISIILFRLEKNWYYTKDDLLELTQDQWAAMKLPLRLYGLLMSKIRINDKSHPDPVRKISERQLLRI